MGGDKRSAFLSSRHYEELARDLCIAGGEIRNAATRLAEVDTGTQAKELKSIEHAVVICLKKAMDLIDSTGPKVSDALKQARKGWGFKPPKNNA